MSAGNNNLRYVCDPVMGDDGKLYVPAALAEIYTRDVLPRVYMLTPNEFEVELLLGLERGSIHCVEDAVTAANSLHALGPEVVVITTLDACASADEVAMLLSHRGSGPKWLLVLPRIHGGPFTGTGDLTAAMLLAWTQRHEREFPLALEKTGVVLQEVLRATVDPATGNTERLFSDGRRVPPELRLVQSKRAIEDPQPRFRCRAVWPSSAAPFRGLLFDMEVLFETGGENENKTVSFRDGVLEMLVSLADVKVGLLTKQGRADVQLFLAAVGSHFDPVLSTDDLEELGLKNKPETDLVSHFCQTWSLAPAEVLVVGGVDFVQIGSGAGCRSCLVLPDSAEEIPTEVQHWDCAISKIEYLVPDRKSVV